MPVTITGNDTKFSTSFDGATSSGTSPPTARATAICWKVDYPCAPRVGKGQKSWTCFDPVLG
jgi:hypothetical protein